MYSIITIIIACICAVGALIYFKSKENKVFNKFLKILVLAFCMVGIFRFFLSDSFIYVINKAKFNGVFYDKTDILQTILRWGYYLNYAVLPMAIFFDSRLFKNIASYICLPFSVLSTIHFNNFMTYFLSPQGNGIHLAEWFRYAYFMLELIMAISIPIMMQIRHKHVFNIKSVKEWCNFLIALPFICIVMMPAYVPQSIVGYSQLEAKVGSPYHIAWIVVSIVVIFALYFMFRFKDYKTRFMLCVFLTTALFFNYNSIFLMGITLPRLPIQLCNLAAYLFILAIPLKMPRLFQFCFLANTAGAIVAYVASDFTGGALGFWNVHFVLEHTLVLLVPILAMWLRIFPRLDKKAIKYTLIGFTVYFAFCFVAGTIINGYADVTGTKVNYFFMFDLDKAFKYVPMLTFSEDIFYKFSRFVIYPIVPLVIYFAFSLLYLLFYMFTRFLYKFEDDQLELRKSAINLYEKITKKKSRLPRDFKE